MFLSLSGPLSILAKLQFGVRIANLLCVNEKLKSLREARLASMPFRQRAHDLRMFSDEARIHLMQQADFEATAFVMEVFDIY